MLLYYIARNNIDISLPRSETTRKPISEKSQRSCPLNFSICTLSQKCLNNPSSGPWSFSKISAERINLQHSHQYAKVLPFHFTDLFIVNSIYIFFKSTSLPRITTACRLITFLSREVVILQRRCQN